jgi:hypothetical protein
MTNRNIPQYRLNKYRVSPRSFPHNAYLLYSQLNNAAHAALRGMDYGCYMDTGDALGLDDVAGFDYGYDEALSGIIDTLLNVGSWLGGAAVSAYKFAAPVATTAWRYVTKLPSIAVKAAGYVYEGGKWVYKSVLAPGYTKVFKPVVSWAGEEVIAATGAIGSIFASSQPAAQAAAPALPVQGEQPPAPGAEQNYVQYPYSYVQPPPAGDSSGYLPYGAQQGFVYNPATGQVEPAPTDGQTPAVGVPAAGKKNLLWYVIGGVALAAAIL